MPSEIDFVLLWVNGGDPDWILSKEKFSRKDEDEGNSANRYRNWDNLQYWFRGVEKFAPWVRKIHLVTCGHFPEWLKKDHPRINLVSHKDFIPPEFLPTFNSNVIELHLHRIPQLSDKFVLFNDDMFLTNRISPEAFFKKGFPCDRAWFGIVTPMTMFSFIKLNNLAVINRHFNKRETVRKHWRKFFTPCYGIQNFRNALLCLWPGFFGFNDPHLPLAYNKEIFDKVWAIEKDLLNEVSWHRFRQNNDVSHWLMRYWQLLDGNFTPDRIHGKTFTLSADSDSDKVYSAIRRQTYEMICVNDSDMDIDFEKEKERLNAAFNEILPEKSSFEV